MKAKLKNWWTLVVGQILALVGFQSCDEIFPIRCEYGQPYVKFSLKGTVRNESGDPVEGIRVAVHRRYLEEDPEDRSTFARDTLYTDKDGIVSISNPREITAGIIDVYVEDVDGPANGGEFESMTLTNLEATKVEEGKSWYGGAYESSFDVRLKKK